MNRRLPKPSLLVTSRMRWTGQIFWLLAFGEVESLCWELRERNRFRLSTLNFQLSTGPTSSPPSPPKTFGDWPMGSRIQLQQRNCSRFSRDFLRRSTFSSSQRTGTSTSGSRLERQDYLINCNSCCHVERLVETSRGITCQLSHGIPRLRSE